LFRIKALGLEQHPAYRLGAVPHIQSNLFVYGQYDVMTGITPVLTEQHNFEIDPVDPLRMLETTQFFSYGSGNHSRLTENRSTASDGFEYTTRIKYADDYVISLANKDHSTAMLARLVEKNVVTPVEKITLRNAVGTSSFQIQNAALTRFSDFSTSGVMPLNHSSLDLSSPLAENLFTPSYIDNTGAQSIFVPDGAYKVVGEYLAYSAKGSLLASRGRELLKTGILLDQVRSLPVFSVHGADPTECIFSDFDCHTGNGFSKVFITPPLSTPLTYDAGRNIGKSLKLQPGLGYGIESPFVKTSNIYVLSYWAKTCAESNAVTADGTFTAKIYNGSTLLGTIHLDFDNPSAWKHYQKPIDISSYSGNLSIRIQSGINDLCVDDVAFYPGDASVSSTQYDSKNRVRMVTDGKGISTYFEYDAFGRLITVRDHNQKIKETVTYNTQN
jgi:YD repeat-containing protein